MNRKDITEIDDPLVRASVAAMQRAALLARQIAIQTGTDLIVMKDGKLTRIKPEALRAGLAVIATTDPKSSTSGSTES